MNPRTPILLILIASCIAFAAPAAAQETTNATATLTNVSAPADAPNDVELVVDENVVVTDYRYEDGQMIIDFWSDEYTVVSVAPQADSSSEAGSVTFRAAVVDADTTTTVRVPSSGGVTLWTEQSIEQQRFHYLRKPNTFIITGPWSGEDVRNAALGSALGVVIAVLYEAVSAKVGSAQRGERLA
ncbi:hypothetical protein Harman_25450 [Haloarcula mannanilytica]|uniref:Uncharacterized protein n=1 Tax=Haloarcula mannanilytica TaxID=2509225 RepID=A0A4C2EMK3_9EURY|nr:hypothetical protein [Haloarcula mannanilytica]GCF14610.1 hypothetical protein Harman_25450 [Haloarcula mannanilytica]